VRTGFFPLYVCEQGRVPTPPERQRLPVERYLRMHHAFLYTDGETVAAVQQHVDAYRSLLLDEVRGQVPERQD